MPRYVLADDTIVIAAAGTPSDRAYRDAGYEPSDDETVEPAPDPQMPLRGAVKADWVEYAISVGVPSFDAGSMTKRALIEHVTGLAAEDVTEDPDDEPDPTED